MKKSTSAINICEYSALPQSSYKHVVSDTPTCDQCRIKKRKCDGGQPCGICQKSKTLGPDGNPICHYSKISRKRKKVLNLEEEVISESQHAENIFVNSPTSEWVSATNMMNVSTSDEIEMNLPCYNLPNYTLQDYYVLSPMNSDIRVDLFQSALSSNLNSVIQNSDLQKHLLHVSSIVMQPVPLCAKDKAAMLLPNEVQLTMSGALKFALYANAAMFSNHPLLHPNVRRITVKHRLDVARKFASKSMRFINNALNHLKFATINDIFTTTEDQFDSIPFETVDVLDLIRAMLALAHFSYGIGEGVATKLINDVCHISDINNVFVISNGNSNKSLWSVDSLVFRVPTEGISAAPQSISEEQERFTLWASCLVFDTYSSLESGRPFSMDERLFPEFIAGWRPKSFSHQYQPPTRNETAGINTIWHNGPFGEMFDRVSKLCIYDLYPSSTASTFNFVVWISVILRRILRTIRSRVPISQKNASVEIWWNETLSLHPPQVRCAFMEIPRNICVVELHDCLLGWGANMPERARAFPSLEIFETWKDYYPETDKFVLWSASAASFEGTLLFLCSFSYLHMGSLDSIESNEKLFKLFARRFNEETTDNVISKLYSSRQVLYIGLKALCFLIKKLYMSDPMGVSEIPSPTQYWAVEPLSMFVIASSGLLATRVTPYDEKDFKEALSLVNMYVLPMLTKFCKIWPIAEHYQKKLESLLNNINI